MTAPARLCPSSWREDPFARGSYSYISVDASGADYDVLARPASFSMMALLAPRWRVRRVDEATLTAGKLTVTDLDASLLTLVPMQIRTFVVQVEEAG